MQLGFAGQIGLYDYNFLDHGKALYKAGIAEIIMI